MGYSNNQSGTSRLSQIKNRAGISIIEVLIALGMVGILSAVIATVLQSLQKAQNQTNLIGTIESMRLNIQKTAADGNSWRQTVSDPANSGTLNVSLNCIDANADCPNSNIPNGLMRIEDTSISNAAIEAEPGFSPLVHLNFSDPNPAVFNPYINTTAANTGFTDKGTPCVGWSAAGNDVCPIRWVIKTAFECQGAGACRNPTVRVIAILYYRPNPANPNRAVINEGKYRVDLRRGAKGDARSERFYAHYQQTCGAGCTPASAGNGGPCAAAGTTIPLTFTGNALDNENNNVTAIAGGVMTFVEGTYNCTAISTCFACGKVRLALNVNGVDQFFSLALHSKRWEQTQVTLNNVLFTTNAPTPVFLKQFCDQDPGGDATLANLNLGIALPVYTNPTKYSEIQCTRIF